MDMYITASFRRLYENRISLRITLLSLFSDVITKSITNILGRPGPCRTNNSRARPLSFPSSSDSWTLSSLLHRLQHTSLFHDIEAPTFKHTPTSPLVYGRDLYRLSRRPCWWRVVLSSLFASCSTAWGKRTRCRVVSCWTR